jgi:riboflavin kinase/FMN adenylyltransferase
MHTLVVGANFALGRGRSGDIPRLTAIGAERGFTVVAVPLLEIEGEPVSSSAIRKLLAAGEVAAAARRFGRNYDLTGRVVQGHAIGRTLGFPTANLQLHEEKFVPGNGIYAVWARIGAEREWHPAAMSVGVRPTFGGQVRTLEVHLLDWSGELVGRDLTVEFADWLRPELRFDSPAALIEAIKSDVAETRRRLEAAPAPSGGG